MGPVVSVLKKEGRVTYFVGADNYFSHAVTDASGQRFIIASLIFNRHVRVCEVESSSLGIPRRTLMHWMRQLDEKGPGSFYLPHPGRGSAVMTPEKILACARHLNAGNSIPETAQLTDIRIHRMACPAHDKAIGTLLAELNQLNFLHPETQARMIYQLA